MANPTLESAEDGPQVRSALLAFLRAHRNWYGRSARFYSFSWNAAALLIIVFGAAASLASASKSQDYQWATILLPALSSLLAAILLQFRLKERCRLREMGRIGVEELISKAYLIPLESRETALEAAMAIRLQAHQIERDQVIEFVAETAASSPKPDGERKRQGTQPG